jgi:hypothetical protein
LSVKRTTNAPDRGESVLPFEVAEDLALRAQPVFKCTRRIRTVAFRQVICTLRNLQLQTLKIVDRGEFQSLNNRRQYFHTLWGFLGIAGEG